MAIFSVPLGRWGGSLVLSMSLLAGCSDPASKVPQSSASAPQSASSSSDGAGKPYVIRPGSTLQFTGSKVTGSHNGGFTNFSGTLPVSGGKIVGNPTIQIDMASTWADVDRLTGHLKSPDFFDVAKFPQSSFAVTSVEPPGPDGKSKVTGNLTLHGVTKSIAFPATIQVSDEAATVKADFAINRKDFGIVYPGKPDDLIRDNVVIRFDLRASP
ncbi:MAG TPA: YceI family protein [Candidatus Dormibacteraeota bacterium]|jgi:polyisoprenoid-binding protein YceI|nr:YceI family protein [Verrucomicrobiae bacterium]HXJ76274.1 YceI family protein [Candidatus Dormibacteraeota bacterium]